MDATFWNNRRVLTTGHTGFKGSWLSLWLQRLGADLTGFSLDPPTDPSMFQLADVATGMSDLRGDVTDASHVKEVIAGCRPEVVFHLAAQPLVRLSYEDPIDTYLTNVMGTVNVLQAVRHVPSVRAVVVVTSDKCYENVECERGYCEDDRMGGFDPYSSSKGCAELVAAAFRRSFFEKESATTGVATVRAGNVIGGGDWATDRLLPDVIRALSAGDRIEIRNPHAVRPWQHVIEPLRGYLLLAEKLCASPRQWSGGWNFGPREEDAVTVGEVVDRMVQLWGSGDWSSPQQIGQLHEARLLRLDCTKADELLGWRPEITLDQALRLTIDWYAQASAASNLRQLTVQQLDCHANTAASAAALPLRRAS